jgi:DNA-binding IclR family transcriptional regulator
MKNHRRNTIASIDKAFILLEHLSLKDGGTRITDISKELNMSIPTMHRILSTMKQRGFVEQDADSKKYSLGLKSRLLGISALNQNHLFRRGLACLKKLNEITQETTNIVIRDHWVAIYILQMESQNALRVANRVGSRVGLYCTAAGKILLSYMDYDLRQKYYEQTNFIPLTPNTCDSKEKLEQEIIAIRKIGIAYDKEEQAIGEACIAAPVFNHNGDVEAAISISSPASRLTNVKMKEFSPILREVTKEFSKEFGFREQGGTK